MDPSTTGSSCSATGAGSGVVVVVVVVVGGGVVVVLSVVVVVVITVVVSVCSRAPWYAVKEHGEGKMYTYIICSRLIIGRCEDNEKVMW